MTQIDLSENYLYQIEILYHIAVCKLFELRLINWKYNFLQTIIIISYLKPSNCLQIIGVW